MTWSTRMLSDDVYRSRLAVTIAALRYWVPSVSDAAETEETETSDFWRLAVAPRIAQGCPFELILHSDQRHDLIIAGEVYEDRLIGTLDLFLPLAEAIAAGTVLQRQWISAVTGRPLSIETLVTLPSGAVWRDGVGPASANGIPLVSRDRHFLPYRR